MDNIFHIKKEKGSYVFSEEQKQLIISLYSEQHVSLDNISKQFNIASKYLIRNILVEAGVFEGNHQGYPVNEHYFDIIDTSEKAYWLGYFYADGTVASSANEISVTSIDEEHLIKFKNAVGAINHKLTKVVDTRFQKECVYYVFGLKRKKLKEGLISHGCVPNKSLIIKNIPEIPEEFKSHFIRGYFDGDGSIHKTNNPREKLGFTYRIAFNGTQEFLNDIKNFLNVTVKIRPSSKGRDYVIQINGKYQLERVLNLIYKDSTEETRLNRKYEKYLDFLKTFGCISLEPVNTGCVSDE